MPPINQQQIALVHQHQLAPAAANGQVPVPHPDANHPAVQALFTVTPITPRQEVEHIIREAASVLHARHQKVCKIAGCTARA
ncbi:hypothetical protein QBC45DRAFT_397531 [Copromyces sp. CBS 386.78]|nr:hypothetical protein QBC45DRAFT_397531 [Copromyces sp. CBS 386.78]